VETRLWPTVDHLDQPDLQRHGCNSDRGPAASGGPTVLANDRHDDDDDDDDIFYFTWSFRSKPLSLTVSEIFNVECNSIVDMTLIRSLSKGQGHSFGTNRFLICDFLNRLSIVTFAVGCTV